MKIKGITIELNADASGIEKALKGINKSLSDTQKDLSAVNKALKLDPKNLELVEQKERLLTKAIDDTKQKVDALRKAQESLKMDGTEESQRQYDALTREISATEQSLNKLNTEQKNFSTAAASARYDASAFGSALNTVGNAAQTVADKTKMLSAAAAGALAGLVGLTVNAARQADDWATTAQQIGLSTEAIQKFEYASDRVDVDMSTLTGAITRMKGQLDSTSGVWERIGVSVRDQKGDYRDIESIFYDVVRAVGSIENETERDTVAMEIFGRKANELAGILDDGGAKLRALGDEAESLGLIVSDEDITRLNEFNDQLDAMKAQLKAALVQAALPALEALEPLVKSVSDAVRKLAQVIANIPAPVIRIAAVVAVIVAAIAPVAQLIANITIAVKGLSIALPIASAAIKMFNTSLLELLANPVVLTVAAITAAVIFLGYVLVELIKHWDDVKLVMGMAFEGVGEKIQSAASSVKTFGKNVKSSIESAFGSMGNFFAEIGLAVAKGLGGIPGAVAKAISAVRNMSDEIAKIATKVAQSFNKMVNSAGKAGKDIIDKFTAGVRSVISSVTRAFQQLADSIKSIWSQTERDARNSGQRTAQNYVEGYNSNVRYNSFNTPTRNPMQSRYPSSTNGATQASSGAIINAINSLNASVRQLERSQSQNTNVTVECVGSAKNIFDTVRVQNNTMKTATGYHALA